jgi:hypothetical protein
MIIHLNKSKLFTVEPSKRFAKEFGVDEKVWVECWFRYRVKGYTINDLRDYIHTKTGRKPKYLSIHLWVTRTEVYSKAKEAFKMEASVVVSSFFGKYEDFVIKQITKHIKSGNSRSSRSIV